MKQQNQKQSALVILVTFMSIGLATSFFSNCAPSLNQSALDTDSSSTLGGGTGEGGMIIQGGVKTAGVAVLKQNYAALIGALQVATPSNTTVTAYNQQVTNLSETGTTATISPAMVLSYSVLAASVCQDRINFEANNANAAQRLFFNALNLGAGPANNATAANLGDVVNRLARALWQRNETESERNALIAGATESMGLDAANNATETREAALYICTAMASSAAGLEH